MHFDAVSMTVRYDDAVVRDHRVHGVRILPGVTYLDAAYRLAGRDGREPGSLALRDVVFRSPVAVAADTDRRLVFGTQQRPGGSYLTITADPSEQVAECRLVDDPAARPADLDLGGAGTVLGTGRPVDTLYAAIERRGITHRDFMRVHGTVATGADGTVVAELSLGPAARRRGSDFLLHPVLLDAATIVAFAGDDLDSAYLPILIGEFRAWDRTGDAAYVRVTRTGNRTGDVLRADIVLYDVPGRAVARFRDLVVKRVRSDDLIQRLTSATQSNGTHPSGRAAIEADLVALVAAPVGLDPDSVDRHAGFYDLGLDSGQLLGLTRTLETRLGHPLYPTLLFEHQSIAALADYLHHEFGDRYAADPPAAPAAERPPGDDVATLFRFDWQRPGTVDVAGDDPLEHVVVFDDDALPLAVPAGVRTIRVRRGPTYRRDGDGYTVDPAAPDTFARLVRDLHETGVRAAVAAYAWGYGGSPGADAFLHDVYLPLRTLVRELSGAPGSIDRIFALWPDAGPSTPAGAAAVGGFARTLRLEQPTPVVRSLRLDAGAERDPWVVLLRESVVTAPDTEVRYVDGVRHVRRMTGLPTTDTSAALGPAPVVLISGGLGGLGSLVARRFAARHAARVVLVGRRPADDRFEAIAAEVRRLGGQAHHVRADLSRAEEADSAVEAARAAFGPVTVIVHAAGVLRDGLVRSGGTAAADVFAPKTAAIENLDRAAGADLRHLVLFSSLSAVVGNPGQADYAAANRYLDGWAEARERMRAAGAVRYRTVSVNWPVWRDGGMGVDATQERALDALGLRPLPADAGLDLLDAVMDAGHPQVAVAWGDPGALRVTPAVHAATAATAPPPARTTGIAIVGISGRFPGADDLDAFWRNLVDGRDCVTTVPASRWRADDPRAAGTGLSRFGGFLDDVDAFDPLFFRLPPATAAQLDPQERLFLQAGYAAVENAGYQPADFTGERSRVGVFVGVMSTDYRLLGVEAAAGGADAVSSLLSSAANRLSYFFGFTGPSLALDTACSSTLTALHLACRSIADGDCDAAVVGGVNLLLHPDKYRMLAQLNMTSSDGRCRSFGAGGDGYVPGEGVGALFLKPLDRAIADGDTIHGVVTGSAVNHGGRSAGYTVPHPGAQADVVRRALHRAGLGAGDLDYVEAHGTGTALGDPVEIAGLAEAMAGRRRPCPVGSVKSAVGHLEAAAGIAAVARVVLQMRHATLAPSLHSARLNPDIDFAGLPFHVPQSAQPWERAQGPAGPLPYRAGISSFGAGGANAHVVIEEYPQPALPPSAGGPELVVLSARTEERLRVYAAALAGHLRGSASDRADLTDVARTLQVGRPALPVRLAFVAATVDEAAALLERHAAGERAGWTGTAPAAYTGPDTVAAAYRAGDLAEAGRRWVDGGAPQWTELAGPPRRRIPLPGYPFARDRFWIGSPGGPGPGLSVAVRQHLDATLTPSGRRVRDGEDLLARYAATALHHRLAAMGLPGPGERFTAAALRDRLRVLPSFERLIDACLDILHRHGRIDRQGPEWSVRTGPGDPAPVRAELLARHPQTGAYVTLLDACLAGYPAVLCGQRTAAEILFPGGSLDLTSAIYRNNAAYDFGTRLVTRAVEAITRPVRVLEIGAGTGGTSDSVLRTWAAGVPVEYHYTDVGPGFVAHGRRQFAARYPFTRFAVLDIERDPVAQGFPPHGFDVILAANSLHAVADIDEALAHTRGLLAPDGVLVLAETTVDVEVLALTFGLLDGWHRYRDPDRRIPHSPLLTGPAWRDALRRSGFADPAVFGPGLSADADPGQVLVVAGAGEVAATRPETAARSEVAGGVGAGVPDVEAAIAAVVGEVLAVPVGEVRADLPFAEYGVDSILAVSVVDRVNERFDTALTPVELFDHPTVRALAAHVGAHRPSPRVRAVPAEPPAEPPVGTPVGTPADVAIVGMSGRFPGADDLDAFWRNLVAGRDSVTEVPADRWAVDPLFQPWPPAPGRTYSRWGGYLTGVDRFDPLFFRLTPAEADMMDPQQRLFLQESWRAIEDAGINPARLRRARCGVFVGAPGSDYATAIRDRDLLGARHVFTGNSAAILPARVAYHLDLTGPCVAVDTACSSSLVAIHQAVRALAAGDCDLALAGGVSVFVTPDYHLLASAMGMLSPTGRCRTFDADADGFVIGEGVGVVVLKPLAAAIADGDPIHGVIRGIGVNQDGRTNGITAPSAQSQTELELDVYGRSGLDPSTFGYVEAHGTGTRLGDPIEVEALTRAFRRYTDRTGWCPIGSVKTNIGHASHAAGMASLFKVLLSMRDGRIPPSLHCDATNPLIDFAGGPFVVGTDPRRWPDGVRRAAISSFGFSGTNAHLVVDGYDRPAPAGPDPAVPVVVPLSARTDTSLSRLADRLATYLAGHPELALADIAATLRTGREPMDRRIAVVASTVDELRAGLVGPARGSGVHTGAVDPDAPPARRHAGPGADPHRIAAEWVRGEVDLEVARSVGRRVNLPTYVFDEERCWLPGTPDGEPRAEPESDRVRQAVLAVAAADRGVAPGDIDVDVASVRLGFDEGSRQRIVDRLNADLGIALPANVFGGWASLTDLADRVTAAQPSHLPTAVLPPVPEPGDDRTSDATAYLKSKLAEACRLPVDDIRTRVPLQEFGIDSVLIASLNAQLEADFGELPKTLFFEYRTIEELAGYLATHHADRLDAPGSPSVRERDDTGIAVIGMAGRYPGARDNAELWSNLLAGRESITGIPRDRWDHAPFLGDDPDEPGTTYARWGGFIDGVDRFDARFFNVPPRDAETMDPQQRLFLESAYAAVEDAGYTPERLRRTARRRGRRDVGVFAGVTYGEYQALVNIPIAGYWAVANRVSYHLGLNGPSMAVDTACSASLTAVHLACESLLRGEAQYAIAGGVNISIHPGKFQLLGYGRWASTDGRCRSFGAGGDGYVPGEGVVTLLLKPVADARADGDRIYGVILGSEVNHGGHTNGFTVPSPNAQAELVGAALRTAGVDPRALSYVEAHGTGTSLGDPIEIAALTRAHRASTSDTGYCVIGSLKSNVGHLEAAAGAAGIVKTLLQLENETIVASLHAEPPNPNIDFAGSPFRVATGSVPWPRRSDLPRVAGVSSFGAGGSNAHVVIADEPDPPGSSAGGTGPYLVVVSARQADRLREHAGNLAAFLRPPRGGRTRLADVAHTLMVGREAFEHRLAVVAASADEVATALERFQHDGIAVHSGLARTHADVDVLPGESDADRGRIRELATAGRLTELADLWTQGWSVDWEQAFDRPTGRVVSLPTYPFARDRHWIVPAEFVRREQPTPRPAEPVTATPATDLRGRIEAEIATIFADLTKLPEAELDPDARFHDFGFDSVSTIRMVNRLTKRYGVRIPAVAIEEHDTIRGFTAYLVDSGLFTEATLTTAAPGAAGGASRHGPATAELPPGQATGALPAAARIEPLVLAEPVAADRIFMTGVTGVLGGKLLHDILTETTATVHCLVRGGSMTQARERVEYFVRTYDPDGKLSAEFAERVHVVLGDVTEDGLGLDVATHDRLVAETDVTIHAAGRTTLVSFYDALAPINVEGTRRMIDFALGTPTRYLIYVSSFSALGDRLNFNHPPFTERDLELGQGYDHLPYQETKYEAEKLVRAATDRGLLWNIMRPGNIMGDGQTGRYPFAEVSVKGVYYDILKTAVDTGVTMLSPVHWDVSPVDYVSAGIIHLGLRRPSYRETYHLTNPDIRRYYDVMGYLGDAGYEVTPLAVEEFHRRATERLIRAPGRDEPYDSQTIEMFKYGVEIFGRVHYEESSYADCTYTRSLLSPVGIECPSVADLIAVYVKHCVEVGYLPPPGARP